MVPADDEQEPETTQQQASSDKTTSTHSNDAPRLTPMPRWLMHWWTPLAIAEGLLRWTLIVAFLWGGQPHWPSSEAMKLCLTITGAGLAFSAWQQRSHDNAANAKQAQATAEREDYWKRREQIFQLLGSETPGLRLGAVSLLAELADHVAHSTQINNTEIQELQQHIISTLCLQLRHEGQLLKSEGTKEDHIEIQTAILQVILERIQCNRSEQVRADWSKQTINLTNSTFLTLLTIRDIHTQAKLDLRKSTLSKGMHIYNSKLTTLLWSNTIFLEAPEVESEHSTTVIGIDSIPTHILDANFKNSIIITDKQLSISFSQTSPRGGRFPSLSFEKCTFKAKSCNCPTNCKCRNGEDSCNCLKDDSCKCNRECFHAKLYIHNADTLRKQDQKTPAFTLKKCSFASLYLFFTTVSSMVEIFDNTIFNQLNIEFMPPKDTTDATATYYTANPQIAIQKNKLVKGAETRPIEIITTDGQDITSILAIGENIAVNPESKTDDRMITCSPLDENPLTFHFEEESQSAPLFNPWNTGQLATPPQR